MLLCVPSVGASYCGSPLSFLDRRQALDVIEYTDVSVEEKSVCIAQVGKDADVLAFSVDPDVTD